MKKLKEKFDIRNACSIISITFGLIPYVLYITEGFCFIDMKDKYAIWLFGGLIPYAHILLLVPLIFGILGIIKRIKDSLLVYMGIILSLGFYLFIFIGFIFAFSNWYTYLFYILMISLLVMASILKRKKEVK